VPPTTVWRPFCEAARLVALCTLSLHDALPISEELASRMSLAMTNALLFEEVQTELARTQKLERALTEEKEALESRVKSRTRQLQDRKSTRLNSSHVKISYAVFC